MKLEIPFSVEYDVRDAVPLPDVIETLIAVQAILSEASETLGSITPHISVEGSYVRVRSVSQESPLKEIFLVALFVAFQDDIESAVGDAYTAMTDQQLAAHFETLLSLSAMIVIYYGIGAAKDFLTKSVADGPSKRLVGELSKELARDLGVEESHIKSVLAKRYKKQGKLGVLVKNAIRFLKPSTSQGNAAVKVNDANLDREAIRELPTDKPIETNPEDRRYRNFDDVEVELHAKDKDRQKTGWAATFKAMSPKRLPLKLYEGIEPSEIWEDETIRGNITVVLEWDGKEYVAKEIHLRNVIG